MHNNDFNLVHIRFPYVIHRDSNYFRHNLFCWFKNFWIKYKTFITSFALQILFVMQIRSRLTHYNKPQSMHALLLKLTNYSYDNKKIKLFFSLHPYRLRLPYFLSERRISLICIWNTHHDGYLTPWSNNFLIFFVSLVIHKELTNILV